MFLEGAFNVIGAVTFLLFAAVVIMDFYTTHRLSSLLIFIHTFMFVVFYIVRKAPPKETNWSIRDWLVVAGSMVVYNFLAPAAQIHDLFIMQVLQIIALGIFLAGMLSLNKSFGLVAANRGIKSSGIYKYLRHPLYAAYFLEGIAFVAQNMTARNIIVLIVWTVFQFLRIFAEEQYLSRDLVYVDYMKKVRWRLIPGLY